MAWCPPQLRWALQSSETPQMDQPVQGFQMGLGTTQPCEVICQERWSGEQRTSDRIEPQARRSTAEHRVLVSDGRVDHGGKSRKAREVKPVRTNSAGIDRHREHVRQPIAVPDRARGVGRQVRVLECMKSPARGLRLRYQHLRGGDNLRDWAWHGASIGMIPPEPFPRDTGPVELQMPLISASVRPMRLRPNALDVNQAHAPSATRACR